MENNIPPTNMENNIPHTNMDHINMNMEIILPHQIKDVQTYFFLWYVTKVYSILEHEKHKSMFF